MAKRRHFMFFKRETAELFFYDRSEKAITVKKIDGKVPSDCGYPLQGPYFPWTLDMMLDWVVDSAHIVKPFNI